MNAPDAAAPDTVLSAPPGALFFDDASVGQVFETGTHRVTEERLLSFAAEFDPQPQHQSEQAARLTPFGGLVASGWHTASIMMGLIVSSRAPLWVGAMGIGVDELRWPVPVRAGDVLRVRTELIERRESRSRPDRGIIRMRSAVLNQRDETVMTATHTIMVLRRR
jgi:acyl dehydratase